MNLKHIKIPYSLKEIEAERDIFESCSQKKVTAPQEILNTDFELNKNSSVGFHYALLCRHNSSKFILGLFIMRFIICLLSLAFLCFNQTPQYPVQNLLVLRDNLQQAKAGDYIVVARNKNYTLLLIADHQSNRLVFEEITVPLNQLPQCAHSWKNWVENNAPGNTCWVRYDIDLRSGQMTGLYSYTTGNWYDTTTADNWLTTLLNLQFYRVPDRERKKTGAHATASNPAFWQPKMVFEGQVVEGTTFNAWKTRWPKDNTDLSNKVIEIYLPQDTYRFPAYFPYWLQISGLIGKAKVRVVDSGSNLASPKYASQMKL